MRRMGFLLPESVLYSDAFGVLLALVAINTLIYVVLAVSKLLPVFRLPRRKRWERSETRSIYPDHPAN